MLGASSCLFFLVHFCCRNSLHGEGRKKRVRTEGVMEEGREGDTREGERGGGGGGDRNST